MCYRQLEYVDVAVYERKLMSSPGHTTECIVLMGDKTEESRKLGSLNYSVNIEP